MVSTVLYVEREGVRKRLCAYVCVRESVCVREIESYVHTHTHRDPFLVEPTRVALVQGVSHLVVAKAYCGCLLPGRGISRERVHEKLRHSSVSFEVHAQMTG